MFEELRQAVKEYLDADRDGLVEPFEDLAPATKKLILTAIAPLQPPDDEDTKWARRVLYNLNRRAKQVTP